MKHKRNSVQALCGKITLPRVVSEGSTRVTFLGSKRRNALRVVISITGRAKGSRAGQGPKPRQMGPLGRIPVLSGCAGPLQESLYKVLQPSWSVAQPKSDSFWGGTFTTGFGERQKKYDALGKPQFWCKRDKWVWQASKEV